MASKSGGEGAPRFPRGSSRRVWDRPGLPQAWGLHVRAFWRALLVGAGRILAAAARGLPGYLAHSPMTLLQAYAYDPVVVLGARRMFSYERGNPEPRECASRDWYVAVRVVVCCGGGLQAAGVLAARE